MGDSQSTPTGELWGYQISIFSALLGLWRAAEVGAPQGPGSCRAAYLCPPNHGKGGGVDQRREALAGWNSPLPVDKLSLIQAWGVVWLLQRERERESGDRKGGGKQAHKHGDTDTHCLTKGLSHAHVHTCTDKLHKGTTQTLRHHCANTHRGTQPPSHMLTLTYSCPGTDIQ